MAANPSLGRVMGYEFGKEREPIFLGLPGPSGRRPRGDRTVGWGARRVESG